MSNLNKARFERQNIRIRQSKRGRSSLPSNLPVRTSAPPVAVDKERVLAVVEQELAVEAVDGDGLDGLLAGDEFEGRVGGVEQRLGLKRLEGDNFEALGASDAKLGFEEVDRRGFRGDVKLLKRWSDTGESKNGG